jgi:hypothetical protein
MIKRSLSNVFKRAKIATDVALKGYVALTNKAHQGWSKITLSVLTITGGMISLPAYADIASMANSGGQQVDAAKNLFVKGCLLVGLTSVGYGLKLMRDKASDRAEVKVGHIVWSLVGGALLCVIWFVVTQLVESTGGSAGNIGQQSY